MELQGKMENVEKDLLLQWGNKKRLRCHHFGNSNNNSSRSIESSVLPKNKMVASSPIANRLNKNSDLGTNKPRSAASTSPKKEDRCYATRGSGPLESDNNTKVLMEKQQQQQQHQQIKQDTKMVWPRLFTTLSSKEKEQDFMAMKGCKLPQRPKKRAKLIQRSILLVSPGTWLSDLCQERYQVREKKTSKKKPRGLKAMGSMETDSERE